MSWSEQETKKYCCSSRSRFPFERLVIRVEDLRQVLGDRPSARPRVVVADVEGGEVERLGRLGLPQPQHVDGGHAIADDGRVERNPANDARRDPADPVAAGLVAPDLGAAAESDGVRRARTARSPRDCPAPATCRCTSTCQPSTNLLIEDAELVADAVADRRNLERRQRVEEAGGQPAEAAVAEARLLLLRDQLVEIQPEQVGGLADLAVRCRGSATLLPRCGPTRNSADRYATTRTSFCHERPRRAPPTGRAGDRARHGRAPRTSRCASRAPAACRGVEQLVDDRAGEEWRVVRRARVLGGALKPPSVGRARIRHRCPPSTRPCGAAARSARSTARRAMRTLCSCGGRPEAGASLHTLL